MALTEPKYKPDDIVLVAMKVNGCTITQKGTNYTLHIPTQAGTILLGEDAILGKHEPKTQSRKAKLGPTPAVVAD